MADYKLKFTAAEIDKKLDSIDNKQNKTLIVTADAGEFDNRFRSQLTNLSHTGAEVIEAYNNNQDIILRVNYDGAVLEMHSDLSANDGLMFSNFYVNTIYSATIHANDINQAVMFMYPFELGFENLNSAKQDKITGTAGDFVVIGEDGNVTTKTIPYAEEATF